MHWAIVGLALDCGGREVARVVAGLALVVPLVLLLALCIPVVVIAGAPPTWRASSSPAPSGASAPATLGASAPATLGASAPSPLGVLPAPAGRAPVEIARAFLG